MAKPRPGVGIKRILENDNVRVEMITLKPGARTAYHRHGVRYTMIACNQGRTVRLDEEGKFLEALNLKPGAFWRRSATFAHAVINVSDGDVVMLKVYEKPKRGGKYAGDAGK